MGQEGKNPGFCYWDFINPLATSPTSVGLDAVISVGHYRLKEWITSCFSRHPARRPSSLAQRIILIGPKDVYQSLHISMHCFVNHFCRSMISFSVQLFKFARSLLIISLEDFLYSPVFFVNIWFLTLVLTFPNSRV